LQNCTPLASAPEGQLELLGALALEVRQDARLQLAPGVELAGVQLVVSGPVSAQSLASASHCNPSASSQVSRREAQPAWW